jgi:ankyrin repeat protein
MSDHRWEALAELGVVVIGKSQLDRQTKRNLIASIYKLSEGFDVSYCRLRAGAFEAAIDAGFLYWVSVDDHPDKDRYPDWIAALKHIIETNGEHGFWLMDPSNQGESGNYAGSVAESELEHVRAGLYTEPGWRLWTRLVETGRLTGMDAELPILLPPLQTFEAVMREALAQQDWYTLKVWFVMAFSVFVTNDNFRAQAASETAGAMDAGLVRIRALGTHREAYMVMASEPYDVTKGLVPPNAQSLLDWETKLPGVGKFSDWWFGDWRKFGEQRSGVIHEFFVDWPDAGSASLDDAEALAKMEQIWQDNLVAMIELARWRGTEWETSYPEREAGLSAAELTALETQLGEPLPPQLRWALSRTRKWKFSWRCSDIDEPLGDLRSCYGSGIRDAVWDGEQITGLRDSMKSWVEMYADGDEDDETELNAAFWAAHFPFADLANGDMLTIDMRNTNPQQQPVRYFSHENDGLHGETLAPDFFSFISRWTALGCFGEEWWSWQPFLRHLGNRNNEFDLQGALTKKWRDWLRRHPANREAGAQPPPVPCRTDMDRAMLIAAQRNDLQVVRDMLARNANPDAEDFEYLLDPDGNKGDSAGITALELAAHHNNLEMLQALFDAGASLAPHTLLLPKLLMHAGEPEHASVDTILRLIHAGLRIDPWPDDRFCALFRMAENRDLPKDDYLALLDAMLARGCDVNVVWDRESVAAKTTLFMRGGLLTQQRLLKAGADIHRRDLSGQTAMYYANTEEQIRWLQSIGLDINDLSRPEDPDSIATRPLQDALNRYSHTNEAPAPLVAALLANGADPSLPDGLGRNAWWYCRHVECAELLEKHLPFNASWKTPSGGTMFHYICWSVNIPMLIWWQQHGLDINAQDNDGNTVLHLMAKDAAWQSREQLIRTLLAHGVRLDIPNAAGKTAREMLKKKYRGVKWE